MPAFIASRVVQAAVVLLIVGFVAFALSSFGDPVSGTLGTDATPAARAALSAELMLDRPYLIRYAHFMARVLHGGLGISYAAHRPVAEVIAERLPATIELGATATVLSLALGMSVGVFVALRRNSWISRLLMAGSLVGMSVPTFVLGILLITIFAVQLGWLPSFGRGGLAALLMPALTLALPQSTLVARLVRAEMIEVLHADFIRFALARGLSARLVYLRHALRNTLVPVITITGLQVGSLLSFATVTETVFQWPGVGLLFMQALQQTDTPVIAGLLLLIGLFYVFVNLVVDLLHATVDVRFAIAASRVTGH